MTRKKMLHAGSPYAKNNHRNGQRPTARNRQMTEANAKAKIIADMVAELKAAGWSEAAIAREVDYVGHALRANLATRDDAAWNYGFI
jgi:hypothetical protein